MEGLEGASYEYAIESNLHVSVAACHVDLETISLMQPRGRFNIQSSHSISLFCFMHKKLYGQTVRFGHDASVCGDTGRVMETAVDTSGSSNATPLPIFLAF